jgi:hypothetical protein
VEHVAASRSFPFVCFFFRNSTGWNRNKINRNVRSAYDDRGNQRIGDLTVIVGD